MGSTTTKEEKLVLNEDDYSSEKNDEIYQLVTFFLAEEIYGVDILLVKEINRMQDITEVPRTAEYVEGVINLRGKVIPVIDLRKRFGLEISDVTKETRIIVIEMQDKVVGMIVDGISKVMRLPESRIEPPSPIVANIDSNYIRGVGKVEESLVILLDMNKLLSPEELML